MSLTQVTTQDKVYYDITITDYINAGNVPPPFVTFNESRSNPIIYNPEEYYLSILRFQLDTPYLPIFIPTIVPFSSNPDETIYSVQLNWTNNDGTTTYTSGLVPIIWKPQYIISPPPPPSSSTDGIQNNSTNYYYCKSYQWFAELINTAIQTALTNLNTAASGDTNYPYTELSGKPPVVLFDPNTALFSILFDTSGFSYDPAKRTAGSNNPITLIFNAPLYQLFSSFPAVETFPTANTNLITIQTDNLKNISTGTTNIILVTQEYNTIALWSPVSSIVFTSNTLPIVPNQLSSPIIYAEGKQLPFSNTSNFQQIITDFVSDNGIYKPSIVYEPKAEFRLVELLGNTPLSNLDVSVFWKDRLGRFNPFRLTSGSSATIKLLFTKKGSYQMK